VAFGTCIFRGMHAARTRCSRVAGFRGLPGAEARRCVGWGVLGWGTYEITRVDWEEMDMVRDLDGRWDVIHNQSIEMRLHARTI
jgi:hypothetical protein